jgi:hypothetical protein
MSGEFWLGINSRIFSANFLSNCVVFTLLVKEISTAPLKLKDSRSILLTTIIVFSSIKSARKTGFLASIKKIFKSASLAFF